MGNVKNVHVSEHYKKLLDGKNLSVSKKKSWELIRDNNANRMDNIALSEDQIKILYGEMFEKWDETARAFSALGMTRKNNSRTLVIMPNLSSTCIFDYALDMTGSVCDFVDPTTSADKLEIYISKEKITDIICLDLLYETGLKKIVDRLKQDYGIRNIVLVHDNFINSMLPFPIRAYSNIKNKFNCFAKDIVRFEDVIANSKYEKIEFDNCNCDELSLITHTSGTTSGIGKPIPLSDYNRNALVHQHDLVELDFEPGMKMLHFIPYFAAYGAINTAHLGLCKGMELQQIPLFKPNDFAELLLKYKPNIVLSSLPSWMSLLQSDSFNDADLSFLKCAVSGGTPSHAKDEEALNDFLKSHGAEILLTKGYGLSEVCGCATYSIDGYNHIGGMGVPMPLNDIKLRDIISGQIIFDCKGKKVIGEALINSPSLTCGVLDGNVVVPTIQIDGKDYLQTKDIVEMQEDGSMKFVERIDRMFPRYDGYNFYPLFIEDMLKENDKVKNCVIVPYFDTLNNGNMPRAYIELEENDNIGDRHKFIADIINNCFISQKSNSSYKANFRDIPREWIFVDKIPKNTMGKEDIFLIRKDGIDGDKYSVLVDENNSGVKSFEVISASVKVKKK